MLGSKNVKDYGNLKFASQKTDLNKRLDIKFENKIKSRKIWCAASTHSPEEILCAQSHLKIKNKYKNILTIIIPRHIDRSNNIYNDLNKLNLSVVMSSNLENINENTDVILVNSYGEAAKFYNISKCVFLGKSLIDSLKKDSGQNPIEAARLGCKIIHGPNISNFKEIYKYLETLKITKQINDSTDLALAAIEAFNQDNAKNSMIIEKIENYGQNIFKNVMMELKKYI
jgi:3-deoxy-D-manno-octulosonic-acid transferase